MKKQIIMLGIVFLLICVGLSGCEEVGIGLTNIGDINANPREYNGKEVTVEGTCKLNIIEDDSGHLIRYKYSNNLNGKYRLTGVITKDTIGFYIEVTKAKAL
jgi:hypothetical protein